MSKIRNCVVCKIGQVMDCDGLYDACANPSCCNTVTNSLGGFTAKRDGQRWVWVRPDGTFQLTWNEPILRERPLCPKCGEGKPYEGFCPAPKCSDIIGKLHLPGDGVFSRMQSVNVWIWARETSEAAPRTEKTSTTITAAARSMGLLPEDANNHLDRLYAGEDHRINQMLDHIEKEGGRR